MEMGSGGSWFEHFFHVIKTVAPKGAMVREKGGEEKGGAKKRGILSQSGKKAISQKKYLEHLL